MAENGILDYQGMNQAIYRGATSNIVVDTQSMSIEIGAGNSSHTSNLHIECDHAANVASIQLNSNVVTEFSRSKKLIKYPRVAMTSDNQPTGYVSSASTVEGTNYAWRVFDMINPEGSSGNRWRSGNYVYTNNSAGSPAIVGTAAQLSASSGTPSGEYILVTLPEKMCLKRYSWSGMTTQSPGEGEIWGSNNGSSWSHVHTFADGGAGWIAAGSSTSDYGDYPDYRDVGEGNVAFYSRYAFIITKLVAGDVAASMRKLEYYGILEYDPEAHGTDVTVKSYPNVPNTDWLEVYYDAKGLADNSTTVNDLKPVGTAVNGVVNGNTSVTDGAFTFDGSGDYIQGTFSGHTLSSGYTMATWIKPGDIGADDYIATFGVGSAGTAFGINFQTVEGAFRAFIWGVGTPGIVAQTNNGVVTKDEWVHIAATFVSSDGTIHLYIDNKLTATGTGSALSSISASTPLVLGARNSGGTIQRHANFTMANFRLFNRALTSDEIYQLYAYQKKDFGHGDLSMTLKAGRLGIGTSEPRAALDVRGDIHGGCPVYFHARKTSATTASTTGALITWNNVETNYGGGYNSSNGKFTAPLKGVYKFIYYARGDGANYNFVLRPRYNGVNPGTGNTAGTTLGNGDGAHVSAYLIHEMNEGETLEILLYQPSGTMYLSSHYNGFYGYYLSSL